MSELSWVGCVRKTRSGRSSPGYRNPSEPGNCGSLQAICCTTFVPCIAKQSAVRRVGCAHISHNGDVALTGTSNRQAHVIRGQRLEYFTIAYNSLEGLASIIAGLIAGSVSLVGFGLDSND